MRFLDPKASVENLLAKNFKNPLKSRGLRLLKPLKDLVKKGLIRYLCK